MKPQKPSPDFPLFAHACGQWAKKIGGQLRYFGKWSDPEAALAKYQGQGPAVKPGRPSRPDGFPLFAHASGQWAAKVGGRLKYFGKWSDPEAALAKYVAMRAGGVAGGVARPIGLTLRELCNRFQTKNHQKVESGDLDACTWYDYDRICRRVLKVFGPETVVETLGPDDFARLRSDFAKTHGPVTLVGDITRTRVLFNFAKTLTKKDTDFGGDFKKPTRKMLRRERNKREIKRFFAPEIRAMLDAAKPQLRAMILLGINCGLGNNDCALLTSDRITGGWLNYPRPKTEVIRECPLWPETIAALEVVAAERPRPKNPNDNGHVFITKYGFRWTSKHINGRDNPISKEMDKLLRKLGIKHRGVSFYALRHTFQTIGEKARDKDAVAYMMGHAEDANDMSANYNEDRPDDERLRAVVDFIRNWLLNSTDERPAADAGRQLPAV